MSSRARRHRFLATGKRSPGAHVAERQDARRRRFPKIVVERPGAARKSATAPSGTCDGCGCDLSRYRAAGETSCWACLNHKPAPLLPAERERGVAALPRGPVGSPQSRSRLRLSRVRRSQERGCKEVRALPLQGSAPEEAHEPVAQGRPVSRLRREEDPEGSPLQAVLVRRPAPALRAQPRRHLPRLRWAEGAQGEALPAVPQSTRLRDDLRQRASARAHLPRLWRPEEAEASEPVPGVRNPLSLEKGLCEQGAGPNRGRPRAAPGRDA